MIKINTYRNPVSRDRLISIESSYKLTKDKREEAARERKREVG
jgi:hypothetical protein